MRWFSPTSGMRDPAELRAHLLVPDVMYVAPSLELASKVNKETGAPCASAAIGPHRPGVARQLKLACIAKHLTEPGEWWGCINDNVGCVFGADDEVKAHGEVVYPHDWDSLFPQRTHFRVPLSPTEFQSAMLEVRAKCEEKGTAYGGVGGIENPFFRRYKWNFRTFVRSDCFVTLNDGYEWFTGDIQLWDDWARTLFCLKHYGSVVCCRWLYVSKLLRESSTAGSMGDEKSRDPMKISDAKALMRLYPGLVGLYKDRPNTLEILVKSDNQLQQWRREAR